MRSFGVQFGNGLYGDQSAGELATRRDRSAYPSQAKHSESQVQTLRKQLIEIAVEQGFDEDGVRTAVVDRMGKSIDDLTAAELGSSGRGRRQQATTRCSRPRRHSPPVETGHGIERGVSLIWGGPALSSTGDKKEV